MLDLKQEVIHHSFGQRGAVIGFKSDNNEVTIPSVHFIETAAGNDVWIRQIEQAGRAQLFGSHVGEFFNATGQRNHAHIAFLLHCGQLRR